MSLSIQTNVSSMAAQENLRANTEFQARTIQRLTSGYRINSSGDDAAGLAVANKFRSDVSELMQGVRNANDGISALQIVDGGLNNVSKMLDRLKTLATQSASTTFTGQRSILDNEFKALLSEIDRQAKDIKLDTNGTYASKMNVYIGGGNASNATNSNAMVGVDLSGSAVDASSLGIDNVSVLGGGVGFSGTLTNAKLNDPASRFTASQAFTVNYIDSNGVAQTNTTIGYTGSATLTGEQAVTAINSSLTIANIGGITAQIGGDGQLQFVGSGAFSVSTTTGAGKAVMSAGALDLVNTGNYHQEGTTAFVNYAVGDTNASSDQMTFTDSATNLTATITLDASNAGTIGAAVTALNTKFQQSGLNLKALETGGKLSFQSTGDFSISLDAHTDKAGTGTGATGLGTATGLVSVLGKLGTTSINVDASATGAAMAAIDAIALAVSKLGTVQGKVGAGQNQLGYAINLAQSQISNFSAAESRLRDADVASEAANLTKAQVLQQTSMAAMAQANSAPQAVMALLRG